MVIRVRTRFQSNALASSAETTVWRSGLVPLTMV